MFFRFTGGLELKAIINGKIITETEMIEDKILIYDEKILEIIDSKNSQKVLKKCEEVTDAKKMFVSPGFIDIHIHGSGGADVMDGTEEALKRISSTITENGVTAFLPTTMTMNRDQIYNALDNIRNSMCKKINGAKVLGAHMEGPFLCAKYKGVHLEKHILKPNFDFIKQYIDIIKIVTLAPEMDQNFSFIKETKGKTNIIIAMAHSNANYDIAMDAIEKGISHITHTFNAMTTLHHRNPGIVGAAFNSDVYCEIIADDIHVHPAVYKILESVKGSEKIILVSDAMRAGCCEDGIYELGGQKVIVTDNSARLQDGTLAGSVLRLNKGVKSFMDNTKIHICSAINLASLNPAKELGLQAEKGSIKVGKFADLIILDSSFNVKKTIVEGKTVYSVPF